MKTKISNQTNKKHFVNKTIRLFFGIMLMLIFNVNTTVAKNETVQYLSFENITTLNNLVNNPLSAPENLQNSLDKLDSMANNYPKQKFQNGIGNINKKGISLRVNGLHYNNIIQTIATDNVNRKDLVSIYNKETETVREYLDKEKCKTLSQKNNTWNKGLLNILDNKTNIKIKLNSKDIAPYIGCYINDKSIESRIKTTYEEYRKINIGSGLERFNNLILEPNQVISLYEETYLKNKDNLISGFALSRDKDGGITTIPAMGGGLCGVSTIFYQNTLQNPLLQVVARRPHSKWYYSYYGPILGLDATIFGTEDRAIIDYKFKNSSNNNVIFKTKDWSNPATNVYEYVVESYQYPTIKETEITYQIEEENCSNVEVYNKQTGKKEIIKSCYSEIE